MPTLIKTAKDDGYDAMDHQAQNLVDFADAGDIAAAEALLTELLRSGHLSGQDRQACEKAIAQARLASQEQATKPKRPATKRTAKV